MARIDADPLDGPTVNTSDIPGTVMDTVTYVLGAGLFFALLAVARGQIAPMIQNAMPGASNVDNGPTVFGNPE